MPHGKIDCTRFRWCIKWYPMWCRMSDAFQDCPHPPMGYSMMGLLLTPRGAVVVPMGNSPSVPIAMNSGSSKLVVYGKFTTLHAPLLLAMVVFVSSETLAHERSINSRGFSIVAANTTWPSESCDSSGFEI